MNQYEDIQVVVFDGRRVNPVLADWVTKFPRATRGSSIRGSLFPDKVAVWRNRVVRWFLAETDLPWLLMLDDDMAPIPATDPILTCSADIAGARYIRKDGQESHREDGEVGCGCMKVSRRALERIAPPWFAFEYSGDGCEVAACECGYFCRKARAAGFHPVKAGAIGHVVPVVVIPPADEDDSCRMKFLPDLLSSRQPTEPRILELCPVRKR